MVVAEKKIPLEMGSAIISSIFYQLSCGFGISDLSVESRPD